MPVNRLHSFLHLCNAVQTWCKPLLECGGADRQVKPTSLTSLFTPLVPNLVNAGHCIGNVSKLYAFSH